MKSTSKLMFDQKVLRSSIDNDGEPWFVAKDLCEILGIKNSRVALKALDESERGVSSTYVYKGTPLSTVNEAGMWTLILRCRDAMTPGTVPYRVRKWVTGEVLPSIRKTGGFGKTQTTIADKAYEMVMLVMSAIQPELFKLLAGGNFDFERDGIALNFRREMVPYEHSKLVPVVQKTHRYTLLMTPTELAERIKKGDYPIADYEVGELAEACGLFLKDYTRRKYDERCKPVVQTREQMHLDIQRIPA